MPAVIAIPPRPLREALLNSFCTVEMRCAHGHPLTLFVPDSTPVSVLENLGTKCPACGGKSVVRHSVAPGRQVGVRIRSLVS